MTIRIVDCKLKKNKYKWRINQNTTILFFPERYGFFEWEVTENWLYNNIEKIYKNIKLQKNTRFNQI